jgi:hypothetical protein
VPVVTSITQVTTAEWVKEVCRGEREATLGKNSGQSIQDESSAALTVPAPGQGNHPVDPTVRLLPCTSSANTDEVPQ